MTIQVFGADATVSYLNRAFTDTSPANAIFKNQVARVEKIGDAFFANEFAASWSSVSNAALSKQVLTNLGVLPSTNPDVALLETVLTEIFATNSTNRGIVVLNLAKILADLESTATGAQAVYKDMAAAWNNEVTSSYTYSSNIANTTPSNTGTASNIIPLSTGVDAATGTAGDDFFNGRGSGTFSAFDTIDGDVGKDTLVALIADTVVPGNATVKNVESVSISTTGAGFTIDATTNFSGVTDLTVSAGTAGAVSVTAPSTTKVNAAGTGSGTKEVFVYTPTATPGTTQKTLIFEGVTINVTPAADTAAAAATAITAAYNAAPGTAWVASDTGGTVTFTAKVGGVVTDKVTADFTGTLSTGGTVATPATQGASVGGVTVIGGGDTVVVAAGDSTVNIGQTAVSNAFTSATVTGGGNVNITDKSGGTSTAPTTGGKLTTVSVKGHTGLLTATGTAITTLNLTDTSGNATIANTTAAHTLNVNLNNVKSSGITDTAATTLNIANTGKDSSGLVFTTAAVTTVNISGDAKITLPTAPGTAASAITSTNTAGVTISSLGAGQKFTGGSGADKITLALAPTVASKLGAGDDTLTTPDSVGAGGSVDAGEGTDTLIFSVASKSTTSYTGFETLGVTGVAGSYSAVGFTGVTSGGLTAAGGFTAVAAGAGLTITKDNGTFATTYELQSSSGSSDVLNLTLNDSTSTSAVATMNGNVKVDGVETINITSSGNSLVDKNAVNFTSSTNAQTTKTITIAGEKALDLSFTTFTNTTSGYTGVALIDGSAAKGKLSINTAGMTAASTGTGLTVKGGSAADTITLSPGLNNVTLGAGNDTLNVAAATAATNALITVVTDFTAGDKLQFAAAGVGAGANGTLGAALASGVSDYQTLLNAACNKTAKAVSWFQAGGDTFVVYDSDAATAGFKPSSDVIVKLVGLVDLTNATISTGLITMV